MPDYSYVDTGGKTQSVSANDAGTALKSAPNIARDSGVQLRATSPTPTNTGTALPPGYTVGPNGAWNPTVVTSSTSTRQDNNATKADITGLQSAYSQSNAIYLAEQQRIGALRGEAIDTINKTYEGDKIAQENSQTKDFASRATSLITSGGGYLGATQSQQGVLQNLQATFQAEKMALMTKRDAAINAANQAYAEKDFAIAKEMANNAKDLQKEIYQREKDFSDQAIKIASENRNQTEFELGLTDKKVAEYSLMDDATFAKVGASTIAQVDANYYPGYTARARQLAQQARDVKTKADATKLDLDILDARAKVPFGKTFTINGQTYTGMKVEAKSSGSASATQLANITSLRGLFVPFITDQKTGQKVQVTIPGSDGVPLMEAATGKFTPEGWSEGMKISGMKRKDFISEFQGLLNTKYIDNYDLTGDEKATLAGTKTGTTINVVGAPSSE